MHAEVTCFFFVVLTHMHLEGNPEEILKHVENVDLWQFSGVSWGKDSRTVFPFAGWELSAPIVYIYFFLNQIYTESL